MVAVLFVCLGNICRSPAGEEILRQKAAAVERRDVEVASCGLGDWHVGESPNEEMCRAAKKRGYTLRSRAQQFVLSFFARYDWILAADRDVKEQLVAYATSPQQKEKVWLMTAFSKKYRNEDVPDPYYRDESAFELVMDILEDACAGFLEDVDDRKSRR